MNKDLADVAASISDREAIDWQSLEETTDDPSTLANLRIVDMLASTLEQIDDATVPDRWGDLEVRSRIDSGASADVFLAYDAALDREVALKLFRHPDSSGRSRLIDEGRLLARVDHPNVVRVYGAAEHAGAAGLWMERVAGRSLQDIVSPGHRLGVTESAAVGLDVARGLAAIHGAGIVHGDIKAANILRDGSGSMRIADFGSGIDMGSTRPLLRISGTPLYLAPELLDGNEPSVASDIYSLGVLLYFLVTGAYPVQGESIDELQAAHAIGSVRLRDVRPDLDDAYVRIVERCLDKDPNQRPASAGELAGELSACIAADAAPGTGRPTRAWISAAVVVIVGLAAVAMLRSPQYSLDVGLLVTSAGQPTARVVDRGNVRLGDRVEIELSLDTPLYIYVFNETDTGRSFGLFPLPELDLENPVAASGDRRLPGDGWSWLVSEPARVETIHIVATPAPLPELTALYASLPKAESPGEFVSRGIGKVVRAPGDGGASTSVGDLLDLVEEAASDTQRESGLTHRRISLEHTGDN